MYFEVLNRFSVVVWMVFAVGAVVALLLGLQWRRSRVVEQRSRGLEQVDTVIGWPPQATRVLTSAQCNALRRLQQALPDRLILAQVPLSRFIEVPTRLSNLEWMRRVGRVTADLMVCDRQGGVVSVIDLRRLSVVPGDHVRKRQVRMARVLKAARIPLLVWDEDRLPTVGTVRRAFDRGATRQARLVAVETDLGGGNSNEQGLAQGHQVAASAK